MTDAEVEDYRTEMEGIKVGVYAFTSSLRHEFFRFIMPYGP